MVTNTVLRGVLVYTMGRHAIDRVVADVNAAAVGKVLIDI
jgi:hypothetical protein